MPAEPLGLTILEGMRCLTARKGFADGETICAVPSAIFSDEEKLLQFLRLPGHGDFRNTVVKVTGVTLQLF